MYININSKDRLIGGSRHSFTVDLNRNVKYTSSDNKKIILKSAEIPANAYDFSSLLGNNTISFEEVPPGGLLSATIPDGSYDSINIVPMLQNILNTAGTLTYTVTVSDTTGKITISATGPFIIHSIDTRFGFTTPTTLATSATGSEVMVLGPPLYIYVQNLKPGLQNINSSTPGVTGSWKVQMRRNFGEYIFHDEKKYEMTLYTGTSLSQMQFALVMPDGKPYYINSDWSAMFLIK